MEKSIPFTPTSPHSSPLSENSKEERQQQLSLEEGQPKQPKKHVHFNTNIQIISRDTPAPALIPTPQSFEKDPKPILKPPKDAQTAALHVQMHLNSLKEMVRIAEKRLRMHYKFLRDEKQLDKAFVVDEKVLRRRARCWVFVCAREGGWGVARRRRRRRRNDENTAKKQKRKKRRAKKRERFVVKEDDGDEGEEEEVLSMCASSSSSGGCYDMESAEETETEKTATLDKTTAGQLEKRGRRKLIRGRRINSTPS